MPSKPRSARLAAPPKKSAAKASARPAKPVRPGGSGKTSASSRIVKPHANGRATKPDGKRTRTAVLRAPVKTTRSAVEAGKAAVLPAAPGGPSSHDLAMEEFERGFRALQVRNFKEAAAILTSIIERYPDEKELHERARVYLAICERRCDPKRDQAPRTIEERMNAATVAINRGAFTEALGFLQSVQADDGGNDAVHYMLAVAHAGLGNAESAVPHLHEAIELNPENRFLAAQDSDLDPIREHSAFVALLDSPPPARRRGATRTRSTR